MSQEFRSFAEFYPFYLSQHGDRTCRRLHFAGLCASLLVLAVVVATRSWGWLISVPLIGYGLGWTGHLFFEHNRPATFKYPLYSFLGDFAMARDIVRGKVKL